MVMTDEGRLHRPPAVVSGPHCSSWSSSKADSIFVSELSPPTESAPIPPLPLLTFYSSGFGLSLVPTLSCSFTYFPP